MVMCKTKLNFFDKVSCHDIGARGELRIAFAECTRMGYMLRQRLTKAVEITTLCG